MRIVIFGTGQVYRENRERLDKEDEIVAFLDNDRCKQGGFVDGTPVFSPEEIRDLSYDKIIIMSDYAVEMRNQLLEEGCTEDTLVHYYEYFGEKCPIAIEWDLTKEEKQKSYLFITSDADYHGGAMVTVYAAQELMRRGYRVVIIAAAGNEVFVEEFHKKGIEIKINQNLPYLKWDHLKWVLDFQKIIVNTYPMVLCALEISVHHPVSLWLHESDIIYPKMQYWEKRIREGIINNNLDIYAVSVNAKQNFIKNVIPCDIGILHYGIPDLGSDRIHEVNEGRLNFAVIGTLHPIKQQLFFLQTVSQMGKMTREQMNILIIGKIGHKKYSEKVHDMAGRMERVSIVGELKREELDQMYEKIDVVVVPSICETMSIVATEAMMRGKICIVSDSAGIAEYIISGENGFVFQNENAEELAGRMAWCIENKDKLPCIGMKARRVYENDFSMEKFGNRLERLL